MIEITVDGASVDPQRFEMHYQSEPFPGGYRYSMEVTDPVLIQSISERFGTIHNSILSGTEASHLFNLLRMFIAIKYGRESPTHWANSVDSLDIEDGQLTMTGVCSLHSE